MRAKGIGTEMVRKFFSPENAGTPGLRDARPHAARGEQSHASVRIGYAASLGDADQ
jgi:hypothetical protein